MDCREDISEILAEHEAIRSQMKWLESTIAEIDPLTGKSAYSTLEIKELKQNIDNLRSALYNIKEAHQVHEEKENNILKELTSKPEMEEEVRVHDRIFQILSRTIMQIDLAAAEHWNARESQSCLKSIRENIRTFLRLITEHTLQEDSILRLELEKTRVKKTVRSKEG